MRQKLSLLFLVISIGIFSQNGNISIENNKNITYLGYIIEMGDPSSNDKSHPIYKIIHQFPENKNNKSLFKLFGLASDIDYSTLVNLMYYLPEFPLDDSFEMSEKLKVYLGFNSDEEKNTLHEILKELNSYYKASNFETIWQQLQPKMDSIQSDLEGYLPEKKLINKIEEFYQQSYESYHVLPTVTLWQAGFAIRDFEKNKSNFALGPLQKNYGFKGETEFIDLTIHEFGHTFVNHIVLKHKDEIDKTNHLFKEVATEMKKQGYTNWETCVLEHFVRAGEVIIRENVGNKKQSEYLLEQYTKERNFKYLSFIVNKLKYYRIDKKLDYDKAVLHTLKDLNKF